MKYIPSPIPNTLKKTAHKGIILLEKEYPNYQTLLQYKNPFELLIAVILSAQTTDEQVNKATPKLFSHYPTPKALANAPLSQVETLIFTTGFYKNKAKNIIGTAQHLVEYFQSTVPNTMEALVTLPGVGRKTAGVVLFHVYNTPAIIVDTHFGRVCRRLGWSSQDDPTKLEFDIQALLKKEQWGIASMVVNFHGRRVCKSRAPLCDKCVLHTICAHKSNAEHIK